MLGIDRPLDVTSRDDLSITPCAGEDIRDHQRVLVDGFGMPEELARVTGGPALLDHSQVRSYVGRCDGEPTSTAISILARGGIATLYSVATRPAWRRRGHGAAVTARAVNDALAAGARWVVLTPSADGEPLYRGLGFAEIARWARWVTPDP